MKKAQLYFATNRNHEGENQWKPTGYGKSFSNDGHENVRFGELTLEYDENDAQSFLQRKFKSDCIGDGEKLGSELSKYVKNAVIKAYPDSTSKATSPIDFENNSSTHFFRDLKNHMSEGRDVVVYIHGYAVDWKDAVASAIALELMLNSKRGTKDKPVKVVLFSWPSNGSNMPYAAYKSDRVDARDSGKSIGRALLKLRDFLATLHEGASKDDDTLCGGNIHLLCHSMGNYVLENALSAKLIPYANGGRLPRIFDQIFLCAPDIRDDAFEREVFSRFHEMGNNVTIYYNHGDLAMNFSKYTKHFDDRLGHTGNSRPALIHNKIHQVDCSLIVRGIVEHSYYLWATVNDDIQKTIAGLPFDDPLRRRKREAQSREWTMI